MNMLFIEGSNSSKLIISTTSISFRSMSFDVVPFSNVNITVVLLSSFCSLSLIVRGKCAICSIVPRYVMAKLLFLNCSLMSVTLPESITCDLLSSVISSHISSTDAMLCVEKSTVAPLSRNCSISCLSSSALIGSKPLNGSSKMSSLGSWSTVVMNCTFCCMPFDSSHICLFHQADISNFSNQCFSRVVASY